MSASAKKRKGRATGAPESSGHVAAAAGKTPAAAERVRPRLFLIAGPEAGEGEAAEKALAEALAGGDVAAVLLLPGDADEAQFQRRAEGLVPVAQAAGAAAILAGDTRAVGRTRADGIHADVDSEDFAALLESLHPDRIVGAGGIRERHHAMQAAEQGADYVFFGLLDLVPEDEAHPKTIALAGWWADVFEVPCVALAGAAIASVTGVALTGADFVAVRQAVWSHPDGPRAAVAEANRLIDEAFASADGLR
ncbi:thiamine phosphate synthase [Pseudoxanthobacter sp.]|uniref:thiamine phosphate synthase n=1 Tax=Pseudoxanthobacter sp. TaxID=1925742 RepID=UPI002FE32186